MDNQSLWYLENIDVKGIFCPQKMKAGHLDSKSHKKFNKGEYIYLPQEDADKVYFITEGQVKIGHYGDEGKEITKALMMPGEVFGELALTGESKRRDFAYAMDAVEVCILTVDDIRSLMRNATGFGLFMMKIFAARVLDMEKRLESLIFKDSRARVVEFLHDLGVKRGQRVGYETLVRHFITHQEIANLTGTSRQTVTTVLNDLRNKNILTFNRSRLLIRDMDRLLAEQGHNA